MRVFIRLVGFRMKNDQIKLKEEQRLCLFGANSDFTQIFKDFALTCINISVFRLIFLRLCLPFCRLFHHFVVHLPH